MSRTTPTQPITTYATIDHEADGKAGQPRMTELQRWLAAGGQPEALLGFHELVDRIGDAQVASPDVRRERACFLRLAPDDPDEPMPQWCLGVEEVWSQHCLFEADLLEDEDSMWDFIAAMEPQNRAEVLAVIEAMDRPVVMQVRRLDEGGNCHNCAAEMDAGAEALQLTARDEYNSIITRPIVVCLRCVRRSALGAGDEALPS